MKLLDILDEVHKLTDGAPYAVIGGLAQILWARKSHADDLDIALASKGTSDAVERVARGALDGWQEPVPPDRTREANDVFQVCHLLYRGAVVDLIAFADRDFNAAIIGTARLIQELGPARFIRPELVLVTHLLRPGPEAALAAVELVIARRRWGGLEVAEARGWAEKVGRLERLERVLEQADTMGLV